MANGLWRSLGSGHAARVERADAAQRDAARSDRRAGAVGAAQVRFLFGLPFAVTFLAGLIAATGFSAPRLNAVNLAWTAFGAVSQVIATSLMLAAMRAKSFVVAVAYTKTEAAQIAVFGLVALNDPPRPALIAAIALATTAAAGSSRPTGGRRGLESSLRPFSPLPRSAFARR